MVTTNMRAVLVSWTDKDVRVRVIFDRGVSPKDIELTSEIESEIISHLPNHTVICQAEACLNPTGIDADVGEVCVFRRAAVI
jgi:hypothetical protein